jgi:replication protein
MKDGGETGVRTGSLGNNTKYVDQRHATELARTWNETVSLRLFKCNWVAFEPTVTLSSSDAEKRARLGGLITCGNVWLCPVCSQKISWKRKNEVNALLHWAREKDHDIQMLTLTTRHGLADELTEQLEALKGAKRRLQQRREWRALKKEMVGTITATEVTHGKNGWHTHFHIIVVSRTKIDLDALRPAWLTCLEAYGLSGNERALQVQDASAVKEYLTKFGAAEELTLSQSKQGRKQSRTPWQLLSDSRKGDKRASALWVEFAKAFKGRRQLVWSNGLKKLAEIKETTDEQAAEDAAKSDFVEVRHWPKDVWTMLRTRRGNLLKAAAEGTSLDVAEAGPTDEQSEKSDEFEVVDTATKESVRGCTATSFQRSSNHRKTQ